MQDMLPLGPIEPVGEAGDAAPAPERNERLAFLIHDMRSVVTSAGLMVELLELTARAGDDSKQRARAASAQNSCRQMAVLCTEAARLLDAPADEVEAPQEFDLVALLAEASTMYVPIYELAGKSLELVTNPRSSQVVGVRSQLFRAISNLLENGMKHTTPGSAVTVTCTDAQNEVVVSVSDDGPGIEGLASGQALPVESLPVVTERRLSAGSALAPGTGLRFVSDVLSVQGGNSTVERNQRGGTTVTLRFPTHHP